MFGGKLSWVTILWVVGIVVAYVLCALYVKKHKSNLNERKRMVEQMPSFISTLGVLGTFFGITVGLLGFETDNIEESIPVLLDGLSTAFFTSLAGMIGSLLLSRQVNRAFDDEGENVSDAVSAANIVVKAVKSMEEEFKNQSQHQKEMGEKMLSVMSEIKASSVSIAQSGKDINTNVMDHNNEMSERLGVIGEDTKLIESALHGEVAHIEKCMEQTNTLLVEKFDEFTELLKQSNTEALVEVMKRVTESFNKQMGELIDKLVKENFDQLNRSVAQLNTWQIENKEMIVELTNRYKQMTVEFGETSNTLQKVGYETEALVSDEGKLKALVVALNKVMIEDERFVQIAQNLSATAVMSKENMKMFQEEVVALNNWVVKQRQFTDGVVMLITKLDELGKIKDYSGEFWKETQRGMNEAVAIIRNGVASLNGEVKTLDAHFYNCLNATLANLDACIRGMMRR